MKSNNVLIETAIINALTRKYSLDESKARLLYETLRHRNLEYLISKWIEAPAYGTQDIEKSAEIIASEMIEFYDL